MDVLKTTPATHSAAKPVASLLPKPADLNRQKVHAHSGWDSTINGAHGTKQADANSLENKHGITHAATLENAKVSSHAMPAVRGKFAAMLNSEQKTEKPISNDRVKQLEQKSSTLVNQFFMGSMLKAMRDDPFKDTMFSGGKGGAAYSGLFDQRIAEHAGNKIAKGLVKSMVKQYSRAAAAVKDGVSA